VTYDFVSERGMAIAIGDSHNEKTFESKEQSERFSLETKGRKDL
jgi:hypothetical protein